MVPPGSDRVSPAPPYSGSHYASAALRVPGFHRLRRAFPGASPMRSLATSWSYNPRAAWTAPVWAPPRSLAATCGITVVFSSSGYLDVSVPRVGPCSRWYPFRVPGCPIRTSADQRAFAPPRGFSQLVASFLASESLGIPRTLLLDFLVSSFNCKSFFFSAARTAAKLTFDF